MQFNWNKRLIIITKQTIGIQVPSHSPPIYNNFLEIKV